MNLSRNHIRDCFPAPLRHLAHPMMPRWCQHPTCWSATLVPVHFMALHCSSSLALWCCAGGCASVAPGSRNGCCSGRRCANVHANPHHECVHTREAHEEGNQVKGARRWGGDHTETACENKVDEGDHCGVRIGGHDVADAHARERCTKRARTSASWFNAGAQTW